MREQTTVLCALALLSFTALPAPRRPPGLKGRFQDDTP